VAQKVLILNGPNLNLLGSRQREVYGTTTLDDIRAACARRAVEYGFDIDFRQSNNEGELVDWLHEAKTSHVGIIFNAGAYTHTSIALMDAVSSIELPVIEVHLSNIHAREEFRQNSYIAKVAVGQICGFGAIGYEMALEALAGHIKNSKKERS